MNPGERLQRLAGLFKHRNTEYGSAYKRHGNIAVTLFPGGVSLRTPEDFSRYALVVHMIGKLNRYCSNFNNGGHLDSLNDLSVYAQMLASMEDKSD